MLFQYTLDLFQWQSVGKGSQNHSKMVCVGLNLCAMLWSAQYKCHDCDKGND